MNYTRRVIDDRQTVLRATSDVCVSKAIKRVPVEYFFYLFGEGL